MNAEDIHKMLDLIREYVSQNGPWQEKKKRLLDEAVEDEKAALEELVSWFD